MPFRRSYTRGSTRGRRPMRRRRRVFRRKPMTVGRVKRIVGAELKFRDLGVGPINIPSVTGSVIQISNIAQGDTAQQREGNWIKPTTWMGTIIIAGNINQSEPTSAYRLGAVCWKENQNVDSISLAKLMQDVNAPHQQYNIQSKGSFKILWSRTGVVSNDVNNPQFQKVLRFYVKPRMKILFDGEDSRKYHLFLFAFSDRNVLDSPPFYSFDTRLRFTDS